MRKHQYIEDHTEDLKTGRDIYVIHYQKCIYCDDILSLDHDKVSAMPVGMARCKKSPIRAGFMEILRSSVDCRGD